jgi:hypothetical protein
MKLKIHGGTAPGNSDSLCYSCRHALIIRGARMTEEIVECYKLNEEQRVTFSVKFCNKYSDASMPSRDDMEDIAWILRTDPKRNQIGFVRPDHSRFPVVNRFDE